ncbi:MAG TPA: hypothetical protein VFF71_11890 [Luteimonas sp.]|nr:hypothetical protein [Luteimonas sp.]
MSESLLMLIDALARQDAEDYLREQASNDEGPEPGAENHALPATSEAA